MESDGAVLSSEVFSCADEATSQAFAPMQFIDYYVLHIGFRASGGVHHAQCGHTHHQHFARTIGVHQDEMDIGMVNDAFQRSPVEFSTWSELW